MDAVLLSLPMIIISMIMIYININDYITNRYSFLAKSRYYSQLPFSDIDVFQSVPCSNDYDEDREKFKSNFFVKFNFFFQNLIF
jgi:hypothetical protein